MYTMVCERKKRSARIGIRRPNSQLGPALRLTTGRDNFYNHLPLVFMFLSRHERTLGTRVETIYLDQGHIRQCCEVCASRETGRCGPNFNGGRWHGDLSDQTIRNRIWFSLAIVKRFLKRDIDQPERELLVHMRPGSDNAHEAKHHNEGCSSCGQQCR